MRLVVAADKLHNVQSVLTDYRRLHEDLWSRFTGGKGGTLWFYRAVADTLRHASRCDEATLSLLLDEIERKLVELERLVNAGRRLKSLSKTQSASGTARDVAASPTHATGTWARSEEEALMRRLPVLLLFTLLVSLIGPPLSARADGVIVVDPPSAIRACPGPVLIDDQLEVRSHRVDVSIADQVATTHIDQVFHNPNAGRRRGPTSSPSRPERRSRGSR